MNGVVTNCNAQTMHIWLPDVFKSNISIQSRPLFPLFAQMQPSNALGRRLCFDIPQHMVVYNFPNPLLTCEEKHQCGKFNNYFECGIEILITSNSSFPTILRKATIFHSADDQNVYLDINVFGVFFVDIAETSLIYRKCLFKNLPP